MISYEELNKIAAKDALVAAILDDRERQVDELVESIRRQFNEAIGVGKFRPIRFIQVDSLVPAAACDCDARGSGYKAYASGHSLGCAVHASKKP